MLVVSVRPCFTVSLFSYVYTWRENMPVDTPEGTWTKTSRLYLNGLVDIASSLFFPSNMPRRSICSLASKNCTTMTGRVLLEIAESPQRKTWHNFLAVSLVFADSRRHGKLRKFSQLYLFACTFCLLFDSNLKSTLALILLWSVYFDETLNNCLLHHQFESMIFSKIFFYKFIRFYKRYNFHLTFSWSFLSSTICNHLNSRGDSWSWRKKKEILIWNLNYWKESDNLIDPFVIALYFFVLCNTIYVN